MNIAVLGTGMVGRTIAAGLAGLGHTVTIGTRDPKTTLARTESDPMGNLSFTAWAAGNRDIAVADFAGAAAGAGLIVNATSGSVSLDALSLAGAENLDGKVILDVATPSISAMVCLRLFLSRTRTPSVSRSSAPFPGPVW